MRTPAACLLVALLAPLAALAAGSEKEEEAPPVYNDVLLFAAVFDYAIGSPDTSLGLTCAGSTPGAAALDQAEFDELNALYGAPLDGWQGFLDVATCDAIRAEATADGPTFTQLVNTGPAPALAPMAGDKATHLFELVRFCGKGCGAIDHMSVIEEPTGYRLIWGVPRIDGSGEVVFDNVETVP